jgi:hypothetical protein
MLLLMGAAAEGQSRTIYSPNFGMQCGLGMMTNCQNFVLPNWQAHPGTFRLWDSGTYWGVLQPESTNFVNCHDIQKVSGANMYCWDNLDGWLDAIANDPNISIKDVIFDFGGVPCQIAVSCIPGPNDPNGSSDRPTDLVNASGSPSFNNFVTNLVTHCSLNGNCVGQCPVGDTCVKTNIIQYYEMWNEPNLKAYWAVDASTDETHLEWMVLAARSIIWSNIPNAFVMTPSFSFYNTNYSTWVQNWLNAENTNGTRSNALAFHVYLADLSPETQYTCYINSTTSSAASPTCVNNTGLPSFLYIKNNTTGWSTIPWLNTETNWDGSSYACPIFTTEPADCTGQIVRWQLLQEGMGASSVDWYYWNTTIGHNSTYEPAYYQMMQYLQAGKFTQYCSVSPSNSTIWTCPFTDANANTDLWVWTSNETAQSYSPPTGAGYINYWDLAGTCHAIPGSFTVIVEPYLLVKTSCSIEP